MADDFGSGSQDDERRIEERTTCDIAAKIELSDRLAIACRIKDLSALGVKLDVAASTHLPAEFDLLVPASGIMFQRHRVRMAWRDGDMVGGEFVSPH